MDAKQLVVRDSPEQTWWLCSACEALWGNPDDANRCCCATKCSECGKTVIAGKPQCEDCEAGDRRALEESLFKSAAKVWYGDYEEPFLYWNEAGQSGEFFRTRTDLEKYCQRENKIPPRWVWGCEPIGFLLDAEAILEAARDRTYNEIRHLIADEDVERLQEQLDEWVLAQGMKAYDIDYQTAVVLDRSLFDGVRDASAETSTDF